MVRAVHRRSRGRWRASLLLGVFLLCAAVSHAADLALSDEERAWLAAHPVIHLGVDPDWAPFEFFDASGTYSGMASDYIALLATRLGVRMEPVRGLDWAQVIEGAERGEGIDLLPAVMSSERRARFLDFTPPYLDFPMVIMTRTDASFVGSLDDLAGARVAVVKGYVTHDLLKADHPALLLRPVANVSAGLEALSVGEVDAYVGNLAAVSHAINRLGLPNLRVAAPTPYSFPLGMGVRKETPVLHSILTKALATVTADEARTIRQRWVQVEVAEAVQLRERVEQLLWLVVGLGGMGGLSLLWNRRLQREMRERRRVEQALRESETKFRHLAEESLVGVYLFQDGLFRYVNPRFCEIFGYSNAELVGRLGPIELTHSEDQPAVNEYIRRRITEGEHSVQYAFRGVTREGELRDIEVYGVRTEYQGRPAVIGTLLDVSDRRRAERAMLEAKETAEEASRAKSEFLATMSHEMRTPMNAVLGMAEVLSETHLDGEQKRYLEVLRHSGSALLELIDDLLDVSRIESGALVIGRETYVLAELVGQCAALVAGRAEAKGLRLVSEIDAGVPQQLIGDVARLRQVLLNLLGNAVKFTEEGTVSLRVAPGQTPGMLHFTVSDSGIGIAPDKLELIFEKFTQADSGISRRYGGTGLGLAISRSLIGMMGGRIWCESEKGMGSRFHFTLPVGTPQEEFDGVQVGGAGDQGEGGSREVAAPGTGSMNILLVEDAEDNRILIQAYLKRTGYRLEMAENGIEALTHVAKGDYDLVLMDMQMPLMDGYTATRRIRERERSEGRRPVPILALTAHALEGDQARSLDAGCDGHLTKPIKKRDLLAAIERYAGESAAG